MSTKLYYGIPAYNEEKNLPDCLSSLAKQDMELDLETIVCLNGCTDNTEKIATEAKEKYPRLNIRTIHSEKGISYAQNAIVRSVKDRNVPLVFVDADVTLDERCIGTTTSPLPSSIFGSSPICIAFVSNFIFAPKCYILHLHHQ